MSSADTAETIEELRRRLQEAEDTLRAIREGQVDALVVGKPEDAQIFTIGGDAESFRTFIEAMEPGAAALDSRGALLYANSVLAEVLGEDLSGMEGQSFAAILARHGADLSELLSSAGRKGKDVTLLREGVEQHYIVSSKPLQIGTISGWAITFTDVTGRVQAELAQQNERAARAVIASANEAVLVCDTAGVVTHANAAAATVYEGDPLGQVFAEIIPLTVPGVAGLMTADDIVAMATGGSAVQGIEAVAPEAPGSKDYLISAAPLQVGNDLVSGCVITMVDLTHRKQAEKQQLLLMRELDHRVKNTLALVLSIAGRTLHHEDTLEGFQKAFTGRIQALAATHNLLAENSWNDLTIRDVITSELAPFVGNVPGRVNIEGLDLSIVPRAAIAFGLIVHELATNAVKYGALSSDEGRVQVHVISVSPEALKLEWAESGGPPVSAPSRTGFGQTVISRSMRYSPHGGSEVHFEPEGLRCIISIPGEDLRPEAD